MTQRHRHTVIESSDSKSLPSYLVAKKRGMPLLCESGPRFRYGANFGFSWFKESCILHENRGSRPGVQDDETSIPDRSYPRLEEPVKLTDEQRREYDELKITVVTDITEGLQAFERAGRKLLRIRNERLCREEYPSFNEFCRAILGHTRRLADYYINAVSLLEDFRAQGVIELPDSERVCRELGRFPKTQQTVIYKTAQAQTRQKSPSYKAIREAATSLEIVPSKKTREVWVGQLMERLRQANRALQIAVDFTDVKITDAGGQQLVS